MKKYVALISLLMAGACFGAGKEAVKYESFINPDWEKWNIRSYNLGLDTSKVPVPMFFDSIATEGTIMVRGGNIERKRWGLHVFEGYDYTDRARFTILVNKHHEAGMPVGELYYFGAVYSQNADDAYYWVRVGSDVPYHSYMFSRDKAIFYGSVDMRGLLSLPGIGAENARADEVSDKEKSKILKAAREKIKRGDFETESYHKHAVYGEFYKEFAKRAQYKNLRGARDGAMYYNKDMNAVLVKIGGKWHKVLTEPVEDESVLPEAKAEARLSKEEKKPAEEKPQKKRARRNVGWRAM